MALTPANLQYFLSSYLARPDGTDVFAVRHDQAVALWCVRDDRVCLVRYWELERVSGQKHHYWPLFTLDRAIGLIADLLAQEGLSWSDISGTWGTPGLPKYRPIDVPQAAREFPVHALAHLFSGMLMDSRIFRTGTIVGVAVDAGPDHVLDRRSMDFWYAGCVSHRGRLLFRPVESPAPLYSAASRLFGTEEGSLMALATACKTTIEYDVNGALSTLKLYGGRQHPSSTAVPFVRAVAAEGRRQLGGDRPDSRFSAEENLQSAVMKCVQLACESIIVRNVARLCELSGVSASDSYLSTSGGFALNCPINSRLVRTLGFKGLLTPPCPNDSGQALGLGLLGLYAGGYLAERDFILEHAYYGPASLGVPEALAEFAPWISSTSEFVCEVFLQDLYAGVVAWVEGAAEIGPRALGHRSLLADPRRLSSKNALNRCKRRRWWRPVAPVVIREQVAQWFDFARPSPFMVETAEVLDSLRPLVPAIAHLDGSARLQTVDTTDGSYFGQALQSFAKATGVPMLCNTSLNDKGEPIVSTAAEALTFCVRRGVEVAYLDGLRVELRRRPVESPPPGPKPRATEYFAGQEADRDGFWQRWQDAGYTDEAAYLTSRTPELRVQEPDAESARRAIALARLTRRAVPGFSEAVKRFRIGLGPGASFDPRANWEEIGTS